MRKLLVFAFLLLPTLLSAQDIIVKRDTEEIEATVIEVSGGKVWYRKFSEPDGPIRDISLKEIVTVRYKTEAPPKRRELPPVPEELTKNLWTGKFKFGLRAGGGVTGLPTEARYTAYGYFFDGTGYGEYHTKTKTGWLVGVAAGYRHALFKGWRTLISPGNSMLKMDTGVATFGNVATDLYMGIAHRNIRYNPLTESWFARKSSILFRFGPRLRIPVVAKTRIVSRHWGTSREDILKRLRPVQAGIFAQLAVHFKGFGIGVDADLMFTNLYKWRDRSDGGTRSATYSAGLFLEYTF